MPTVFFDGHVWEGHSPRIQAQIRAAVGHRLRGDPASPAGERVRFQERHGRLLKLVGGMIMLALAFTLIWNPGLMNRLGTSLLVFGLAIAAAFAIHAVAKPHTT